MKNNYIPLFIKDKFTSFINYFLAFSYLIIAIFMGLSMLTFSINDNSFLTSTSQISSNIFGNIGSYLASFIYYSFGLIGYGVMIFFISFSILTFMKKKPSYFFIRLLIFLIGLVFIPQTLFYFDIRFTLIEQIDTWGIFSKNYFYFIKTIFLVTSYLLLE